MKLREENVFPFVGWLNKIKLFNIKDQRSVIVSTREIVRVHSSQTKNIQKKKKLFTFRPPMNSINISKQDLIQEK